MPVQVDVPRETAEKLNAASAARRWYPFDKEVIDWSVPLSNEWAYMPAGHSIFSRSGILERLSPEDRSFVERWEMTQTMRNVGHGEHLLNQGILALLWSVDQYDPNYRYLLHEVAEECQHMAMFNEWVRINSDIKTRDAGEEAWAKTMYEFTQDLAVRLPEAFWANVLLFEFVGDYFNQAMKAKDAKGDDGRPLHPILRQIGAAHTAEEARHISYARKWLHEGMPRLNEEDKRETQGIIEFAAQLLVDQRTLLPIRYSRQLEPYMSKEEFEAAKSVSPASQKMLSQLHKLLKEFAELEVIRGEKLAQWESSGAFGPGGTA
jgi:hypothetical protein